MSRKVLVLPGSIWRRRYSCSQCASI